MDRIQTRAHAAMRCRKTMLLLTRAEELSQLTQQEKESNSVHVNIDFENQLSDSYNITFYLPPYRSM